MSPSPPNSRSTETLTTPHKRKPLTPEEQQIMGFLTFEELIGTSARPTKVVLLKGGGKVEVTGLTRSHAQVIKVTQEREGDMAAEARMLSLGLSSPAVTLEQASKLQQTLALEDIVQIVNAISEISGMGEASHKEAYKSPRQ